ncbi:protein kinase [Sorangium sp. So ce134]
MIAGRYQLLTRLGEGGHGEVWEAQDPVGRERVAVKLLRDAAGPDAARVRREVAALRMLRCPGVVQLLDEGIDQGRPFLVMELVNGSPFPGAGLPDDEPPARQTRPAPADDPEGAQRGAMTPHAGDTGDPATIEHARPAAPRAQRGWRELAGATVALLEILGRVHAQGVVHRDLKPANVLVTPEGRPTLLDFGLSFDVRLSAGLTEEGQILGTPAYLAPEQILGDPVGLRADLYALGVMLYEALAGRLPHEVGSFQALLFARVTQRPRPLRELAPGTPAAVAEVVDRLLERSPDERPRSAGEVLCMLRGQSMAHVHEHVLPRLGGDEHVRAIVDAARAGRPATVVGPAGSGRSRCLQEAAAILEAEGRAVTWTRPGRLPFASLEALLGSLEQQASSRLDDVTRSIDQRLDEALAAGAIVLVDDAERLDRWSSAALDRCRASGAIVEAALDAPTAPRAGAAIRVAPLDEAALRPLFAGSERLFHLRSDAARALWARTGGLPARVAAEVDAWVRSGIARWDGDALAIDRDAIDRLDAGLCVALPAAPGAVVDAAMRLDPLLEDMLLWMGLALPEATPALLSAATGHPLWRVEATLDELVRLSAAARLPDGRVEPRALLSAEPLWSAERRRAAHLQLARLQQPGADGRLLHLIAGHDALTAEAARAIAGEAIAAARRIAAEGRLGHAVAALGEGLHAVRQAPPAAALGPSSPADALGPSSDEEQVLAVWVEVALADGTAHALDRVLYEICRAREKGPAVAHLEVLVRAALTALGGSGERALAAATAVPPFAAPDLERRRQGLRVAAARGCSVSREEEILAEVALWAERAGDPRARARLAGWMGRLRYRQGRFDESAALHAAAAEGEPWVADRVFEALASASSLLEAFCHREAAERARAALELCRRCRHPFYEARAEWILRAAAYRMGETSGADLELVGAVALLGAPVLEPLVCVTEAAAAWRAADLGTARALASRAHRAWQGRGSPWPALLARGVALAAGDPAEAGEIAALMAQAQRCPVPGLGVQILGLLALADPGARPPRRRALGDLVRAVARRRWGLCMDVLSIEESLAALRVPLAVAERAAAGAPARPAC